MFSQVVMTLFGVMERTEAFWRGVKGSMPVETFGTDGPPAAPLRVAQSDPEDAP